MTVIFGTLGFTPEKLLPSVAAHDDVTHLHFYHDQHARSREAARRVKAFCGERELTVTARELDAFDVIACAVEMRTDIGRHPRDEVVFNVTGGTPVVSAAATLASILEGVRAVFVDERTGEVVPLPLLSMRYADVLNEHQRRVLGYIDQHPACTQADLTRALDLSRATVSHHVTNLKRRQLLDVEPDPADARRERLSARESAALLLLDHGASHEP